MVKIMGDLTDILGLPKKSTKKTTIKKAKKTTKKSKKKKTSKKITKMNIVKTKKKVEIPNIEDSKKQIIEDKSSKKSSIKKSENIINIKSAINENPKLDNGLHYKAEWIHRHFIYNQKFEPHTLQKLITWNLISKFEYDVEGETAEEICLYLINMINKKYGNVILEIKLKNGEKGYIYRPKKPIESQ